MVADLERLLAYFWLRYEYMWIDIACIDQKRDHVKVEEVGRQASIFKLSRQVYVWLNKHEPEDLQHYLQAINSCIYTFTQGGTDEVQYFEDILASILNVVKDPLFSPFSTLQESVLRRMAILLDERGQPVSTHRPWNTGASPFPRLMGISGACVMARHETNGILLAWHAKLHAGGLSPRIARVLELRGIVHKFGIEIMLCPNPNIQCAAVRPWKMSHPEDHIYAIMRIYG